MSEAQRDREGERESHKGQREREREREREKWSSCSPEAGLELTNSEIMT